jgi:hypothetical protein
VPSDDADGRNLQGCQRALVPRRMLALERQLDLVIRRQSVDLVPKPCRGPSTLALVRRLSKQSLVAAGCTAFLAWFAMRFYMDTANDTETLAFSAILFADAVRGGISVDGTGHATLLAQYVLALFDGALQPVTGAYLIRGIVATQLLIGLILFGAAYGLYRRLGLTWLASLLGINLLAICVAAARQSRGWELDKLLEPALYLTATIAMCDRRPAAFIGVAALAALNRETGIFVPLIAFAWGAATNTTGLMAAILSLAIVLPLRILGSHPTLNIAENLNAQHIVGVLGGLCLTPVLGVPWIRSASPFVRRLTLMLAPMWLTWILVTDDLGQGAPLLGLTAVLFVPLTLQGVQAALGRPSSPGLAEPAAPRSA